MAVADLTGINFPFSFGTFGFPETVSGVDVLGASLRALLLTGRGDIPMNPEYGLAVHSLVFKTITPILKARIMKEVRGVIEKFEPRVTVLYVLVEDNLPDSTMIIKVGYDAAGVEDEIGVQIGEGT